MAIFWEPEAELKASSFVFHHCNLLQWARVTFMTTYRGTLILGPEMRMKYKSLPSSYWIGTNSCRSRETMLGFSPCTLPPSHRADLFPNVLRRNAHINFYQLIGESLTPRTKPASYVAIIFTMARLRYGKNGNLCWGNNAMTQLSCCSPVCKETAELQGNFIGLMIHEWWHIAFLLSLFLAMKHFIGSCGSWFLVTCVGAIILN